MASPPQIWLALSTSGDTLSVALQTPERVREVSERPRRGQPRQLTPLIDQLLGEAGLRLGDVDVWVCDVGPGTFTGLRQGLSLARGLAWALQKPLYGVSSLEALLFNRPSDTWALLPARRDAWYLGVAGAEGVCQASLLRDEGEPANWPLYTGAGTLTLVGPDLPEGLIAAQRSARVACVTARPTAGDFLRVSQARLLGGADLWQSDPLLVQPHYLLASEPEQVHGEVDQQVLPATSL